MNSGEFFFDNPIMFDDPKMESQFDLFLNEELNNKKKREKDMKLYKEFEQFEKEFEEQKETKETDKPFKELNKLLKEENKQKIDLTSINENKQEEIIINSPTEPDMERSIENIKLEYFRDKKGTFKRFIIDFREFIITYIKSNPERVKRILNKLKNKLGNEEFKNFRKKVIPSFGVAFFGTTFFILLIILINDMDDKDNNDEE